MIRQLNPYIVFNGAATQAIRHYESALGARLAFSMPYGEAPGMSTPPEQKDLVMHATMQVGDRVLMIADAPPGPAPAGAAVQIMLEFSDKAELVKAFDALSAGGKVDMPLQDTFWNAHFGMLTDAYGVRWLLTYPLGEQK